MKKRKFCFLLMVAFVFAGGLMCYTSRHTANLTAGSAVEISAGQAILIDGNTGKILYEKAADERAYPASTTKIMTALLTLETLKQYGSPVDQMVTVPENAAGVEGSSLYLKAGERISIEDLLYGMMLVSGNDAAVALSEIIGGNEEQFVERMNRRAKELGCRGTHFCNPNGLFDENHYTTVRDMATIAGEAMKLPEFRRIVATEDWKATRPDSDCISPG